MKLSIVLTPQNVTRFLLKIIGLLFLANLVSNYLKWELGYETALGIIPLFDFDHEYNLPTLYSTLALLFSAGILWYISKEAEKNSRIGKHISWKILSLIFLFLSLDELISIHNNLGRIVPTLVDVSAYLNGSRNWTVVYIPLLLLFLLGFYKFFFNLPKETRLAFFISGCVFVGGAIGVEIAGDQYMMYHAYPDIYYGLLATMEELMEMVGIVLFIRALIFYISVYSSDPKFNIQLKAVSGVEEQLPLAVSSQIKSGS